MRAPKARVKMKKHKKKVREKGNKKEKRRVVTAAVRRKKKVREGRNQIKKDLLKCPITLKQ